MSKRRSGLGKGLDALLPASLDEATAETEEAASAADAGSLTSIPIEQLFRSPYQPRRRIGEESIDELAASIRSQGLLEPIIVRPRIAGGFEIIAGERRWRAAQRAELDRVPAVVRDADDREAMAIALVENIQREDLNPLEEARALKRLLDEFAYTHEALADAVGKSRTAVTNLLRLLNLAPAVRELLDAGEVEMGHARALLPLPEGDQNAAAQRVVKSALSVRQTEALVKQILHGKPPGEAPRQSADADTRRLERALSERLGAPTAVAVGKGGAGRIVIRYGNLDELDGLLERLGLGKEPAL